MTRHILQVSDVERDNNVKSSSVIGVVRGDLLLKWADACACLSAERHAKTSSVTLSMDDVIFSEKVNVRVGDVLCLRAQVNRAFNTSMEIGLQGVLESDYGRSRVKLFSSYFVFVSLVDGKKKRVPPLIPGNDDVNKVRWHLAAERRKIRFSRKTIAARVRSVSDRHTRQARIYSACPKLILVPLPSHKYPARATPTRITWGTHLEGKSWHGHWKLQPLLRSGIVSAACSLPQWTIVSSLDHLA